MQVPSLVLLSAQPRIPVVYLPFERVKARSIHSGYLEFGKDPLWHQIADHLVIAFNHGSGMWRGRFLVATELQISFDDCVGNF